jgi:hypothetical protein
VLLVLSVLERERRERGGEGRWAWGGRRCCEWLLFTLLHFLVFSSFRNSEGFDLMIWVDLEPCD